MRAFPGNESYKDSGVEWIGDVPSHWEVLLLKFISTVVTGNTPSRAHLKNYSNNGVIWIKPDDLKQFNPNKSIRR